MNREEAMLVMIAARDASAFCKHVPDGDEILLSNPTIALSSDGRLMAEIVNEAGHCVRYLVADDGVFCTTQLEDGRVEVVAFQNGTEIHHASVGAAAAEPPPINPEVN